MNKRRIMSMEQKKMSRETYWETSGNVNEERDIYQTLTDVVREEEISYGDAWLTLFCC